MFRQNKRRTAGRKNFEPSIFQGVTQIYNTRLSFYDIPPIDEITLEEFETWAIDRLKILIEIESCGLRSKSLRETEQVIKPLLLKYLPLNPNPSSSASPPASVIAERKKDHYSHFILRLVFCRTEDLRRKFIKNELVLFKIRYNMLQPKEQREFIAQYSDKLPWQYISQDEKLDILDDLFAATSSTVRNSLVFESGDPSFTISRDQLYQHIQKSEQFIKLPFEKVPNLVASRSVLLRAGSAYIPSTLQLNLLSIEYQDLLTTSLIRTFQSMPRLEEDDRLLPLLNNLSANSSSIEYDMSSKFDAENASDINAVSVTTPAVMKHYPMCATHLQGALMSKSHLKYQGRQQLQLFLKGIGLSIDEAMKFWSYQFTKSNSGITMEKFNKEYKYNLRHNYGLEGARINYKPPDCSRILSKPKPGKGESHGCPYRDLPLDSLITNLNEMGVTDQVDINMVVDDVGRNDYTVACTRVFEFTHKQELAKSKATSSEGMHINHPNLYFDRSRQLEKSS
ncbi:DNA primase large subunit [[Candida] railenensis]|uniref:DNA primase large subunit n=1 Tax=[Candida] railenensis TaxID=45579 RepID=A0A9P0VXQ1_9ASCO|nr:DNA primase large subunit [[Candida] railenensis]